KFINYILIIMFMYKNKKGQLTIFIIVGIVIVVSIVLYFVLRSGVGQGYSISQTEDIKTFIDACVDETSVDVIERIGLGGGYYYAQDDSIDGVTIYYSYYDDKFGVPLREEIEREISDAVTENLFFCLGNFNDFENVELDVGELEVLTTITDESIDLDISYPIRVMSGDNVDVLRDFETRVYVRLGVIYDSLVGIVEDNKEGICLTCILDNDLKLNVTNLEENTFMFSILDEQSELNDKSYEWDFAMEYEYEVQ
ncbi:MAG: hypothetical protein OQK82_05060, partial [Candidatus Pacearchaeota archaeon]|nr:hypothetical protein [Candidatus Pacearchaeota archaeon]